MIGKRTDNTALTTMIDLKTGIFYAKKYDRTALDFARAIKEIIDGNDLWVATLTIDSGSENALLWTIIDKSKIFNCRPYCSGDKGTLGNVHRLPRRIIPKGKSLNNLTDDTVRMIVRFTNTYFRPKYGII